MGSMVRFHASNTPSSTTRFLRTHIHGDDIILPIGAKYLHGEHRRRSFGSFGSFGSFWPFGSHDLSTSVGFRIPRFSGWAWFQRFLLILILGLILTLILILGRDANAGLISPAAVGASLLFSGSRLFARGTRCLPREIAFVRSGEVLCFHSFIHIFIVVDVVAMLPKHLVDGSVDDDIGIRKLFPPIETR